VIISAEAICSIDRLLFFIIEDTCCCTISLSILFSMDEIMTNRECAREYLQFTQVSRLNKILDILNQKSLYNKCHILITFNAILLILYIAKLYCPKI